AAASAIPGLIELLLRGPSTGRATAAIALGRIAPTTSRVDQALDALSQSLRSEPDLHTTSVVIEAIGWFGPKAGPAIPRLEELVQSPNLKVSGAAQSALAILKVTQ
ncbi:MAG: HEAT repeat domain-containing protein, partial [Isosphaeraceae bacterium]